VSLLLFLKWLDSSYVEFHVSSGRTFSRQKDAGGGIRTHESLRNRGIGNTQCFHREPILSFAPFHSSLERDLRRCPGLATPARTIFFCSIGLYIYLLLSMQDRQPLQASDLVEKYRKAQMLELKVSLYKIINIKSVAKVE
jgi:hypothetical protein